MDEFDNLLWVYHAVFKQTDVGGGSIAIRIRARERTVILTGYIGPDNYAAGRSISVVLNDGSDNIGLIHKGLSLDSQTYPFPRTGEGIAVSVGGATEFGRYLTMGADEEIRITAASLIQNEEVTLSLRAMIRSWPPTFATTGSGGTVTITEDYNKVI